MTEVDAKTGTMADASLLLAILQVSRDVAKWLETSTLTV